jgi:hypothetical protein
MRIFYCLLLLLSACASHEVRCDKRLEPINRPAPAVSQIAAPSTRSP